MIALTYIFVNATAISVSSQTGVFNISSSALVFYFFLLLVLLVSLFFIIRKFLGVKSDLRATFNKKIFKVSVPKYESETEDEPEKKWQDYVSHTEALLTSLGGLKSDSFLKSSFKGTSLHVSFEIVAQNGEIFFYLAIPFAMERFILQQLHAQLPDAQVEEVNDYNIFRPQSVVYGSYLVETKKHVFPLKTFNDIPNDPLNALTNALSKLSEDEGAAIQVLAYSARPSWRTVGREIVSKLKKGENASNLKGNSSLLNSLVSSSFKLLSSSFQSSEKNKEKEATDHTLSPLDEKMIEAIEEKMSKAGLNVNIRVVVATGSEQKTKHYLQDITNSFSQYNIYEYGNSFKSVHFKPNSKVVKDFIYRNFNQSMKLILNTTELASIFHFPHRYIETANIHWLPAHQATPPVNLPKQGLLLGQSNFRGSQVEVRIKPNDRRHHVYIIGQTGTGKSNLMKNMMIQDIHDGQGCCVIDPHGDLAQDILRNVPEARAEDVIYFNPADTDRPMALNMLEFETPEQKTFVVNELLAIFDKLYDLKATGGPMFEQYMRNALLLVMSDPASGMTLLEVPKVLSDESFRKYKLSKCDNLAVRDFWLKEAQQAGGEAALANMVPYITSKLTPFIANDIMRPIISQQKSSLNFRDIMDNKKILIVNLTKGKLGDINSGLLGMIITGKILMASLSRVDLPEDKRNDFYLYIDEFQNFTTDSIAIILSEARKYRLNLTIANQYIGQLEKHNDSTIKDAVFGNVGTTIAFRIGVEDAETIAKQLAPSFNEHDVVNIPKFTAYVKLLIDNANPPAFNISISPSPSGNEEIKNKLIDLSRTKYGRSRETIELEISQRLKQEIAKN